VPGWSPEIANEFIRVAAAEGRAFDESQLQKLVYIAHGWCLAVTGEPLTADRPEAWRAGPVYRRLAEQLKFHERGPVLRPISVHWPLTTSVTKSGQIITEMDPLELDLIRRVSRQYGCLSPSQLSILTRSEDTPWRQIYDSGRGQLREISHALIREQFVRFAQRVTDGQGHR
jgi:uncharacterized phage-associated protein